MIIITHYFTIEFLRGWAILSSVLLSWAVIFGIFFGAAQAWSALVHVI
jgi:hypothetical protein